ncbi:hypothetical protein TTHERM_00036880 (macronuclear) [Tetrahymena thermophila SB210]|uniref:Uncharacterized protein n=1 Tax=Tetrahymena thermophila (strain SB210) TaxID=312017 RepID=Q22MD1_TETTS|nr:hypothetical protein TTHERM_00036880 [Tetrahymena thermophila SB210]EAR86290.1 hypothetical protein TTHERM_00036880 [Tetrahymena thermophila SB210]|eukprot:XP_977089.1 hypothetical protein TTHERM_00036880 [Tetrahymena thermophila SB210]
MHHLENQNALNNVAVLFLDLVEKQQLQKTRETESWILDNDSPSLLNCDSYLAKYSSYELTSQQIEEDSIMNLQLKNVPVNHKDQFIQKQNTIKNILKSFQKYLVELKDVNLIQKYQQMYNNNKNSTSSQIQFSEIKKYLSKKINKKATRWNLILKSIVECKKFQPLFYDYLVNQSDVWLKKSRVTDLVDHQILISKLIKCIEDDVQINLKVYKKKK